MIWSSNVPIGRPFFQAPEMLCFKEELVMKAVPIAADLMDITSARAGETFFLVLIISPIIKCYVQD